jgi:uncharacterized protein with PIN domain
VATVAEPTEGVLYADTSALVKLVVREAESDAIEAEVARWDRIATSDIAAIELPRAASRARADERPGVADGRVVLELLAALSIVPMTDEVRALAATMEPVECVRSMPSTWHARLHSARTSHAYSPTTTGWPTRHRYVASP